MDFLLPNLFTPCLELQIWKEFGAFSRPPVVRADRPPVATTRRDRGEPRCPKPRSPSPVEATVTAAAADEALATSPVHVATRRTS